MMTQQKSTLKQRRVLKNAKIRKDAFDKSSLPSSLPSAYNSRTTSNSSQPPKKTRRRKPSAIIYSQHLEYIRRCKEQARSFCQDTPVQATHGRITAFMHSSLTILLDSTGKIQLAIDECIPGELMVLIFTFLDPAMLFETLMFVSKRWLSLAKDNTLWKPIVQAKVLLNCLLIIAINVLCSMAKTRGDTQRRTRCGLRFAIDYTSGIGTAECIVASSSL